MSTNKHAQIRYLALDKCFRNPGRRYFIEDLIEACNYAIYEFTGTVNGVKRRQIYDDIRFMESSQGWNIPLNRIADGRRAYYRYADLGFTIGKEPLTESEAHQIRETLYTLSRFKGMPQFEWIEEINARLQSAIQSGKEDKKIIEFDQNPFLKGLEHITPLYNAILYQTPLSIAYLSFKSAVSTEYFIHPYFLKQYNHRWYLFGWNESEKFIMNIPLDRIEALKPLDRSYIPSENDFTEYFDDVVGVTIVPDNPVQKILLQVEAPLWPYVRTKPIHGSQKVIKAASDFVQIELEVMINYELETLLFSYGDQLLVLSPESLKERLISKASNLISRYN